MMRTRLHVWTIGLALSLAVGGSVESPKAHVDEEKQPQKVVVTSPQVKDVVVTQHYPCQIHARRHAVVRTPTAGYLEENPLQEGQAVKKGEVLFHVIPFLHKAKLDAERAEVKIAEIELASTKKLFEKKAVSQQEVALYEAKLAKAQAKATLAEVELSFTTIRAPFDGLIDRVMLSPPLVKEGEVLTTLSDNSVMWVYFHVPEARYLKYRAQQGKQKDPSRLKLADSRIELILADDSRFNQDPGNVVTVESKFNNETGTIAFRADFPNPDRLLRHGLSGTVLIHQTLKNVTVIPQRATFEVLDRRYVWVVDKDNVVHQTQLVVQNEADDIFVIKKGLEVTDKIVLEGVRQLRDGDKVEYEFRKPEKATGNSKKDRQK